MTNEHQVEQFWTELIHQEQQGIRRW